MAFTHSISYLWGNGTSTLSAVISQTADNESNFDIVCNAPAVNSGVTPIALNFGSPTNLKSIYIVSDAAITLTFTITSGTPSTLTVTLAANTPYQWINGNGIANPFGSTGTISACSVTNSVASTNPNLKMRCLISA